ncbi:hypothetical protein [Rhodothermus marinus]|jgi:NADH:ubiquinone oxidoreductase subunit H|uniref:hypothetical protein n=1 Tax=Rhodothermus marinus TaxID=29549 RepID=UPI0003101D4E|nr:hypothetical protein [Rhodothermus marinus]
MMGVVIMGAVFVVCGMRRGVMLLVIMVFMIMMDGRRRLVRVMRMRMGRFVVGCHGCFQV